MSILNLDQLLVPIPGDLPTGEELTANADFMELKIARSAAGEAERKLQMGDLEARADWLPILELAPGLLESSAKNLQVAAWLLEALVREHGFEGLREGLELTRRLVEDFWDQDLQPRPDKDEGEDESVRVATLAGLNGLEGKNGTLIAPITRLPLTDDSSRDEQFCLFHYRQAARLEGMDAEERSRRIDAGEPTVALIERSESATPHEALAAIHASAAAAREELERLADLLEEKLGPVLSPPTALIRATLDECLRILEASSGGAVATDAEATAPASRPAPGGTGRPAGAASSGPISNREEAFQRLQEIADFFKRTEPHSPLSYTLKRVVRWGRLPLPKLWKELMSEDASSSVFRLVGISDDDGEESVLDAGSYAPPAREIPAYEEPNSEPEGELDQFGRPISG